MESKNLNTNTSFDLFKNFGISNTNIFNRQKDQKEREDIYIIQQDPMKKNFSEGAIQKIPSIFHQQKIPKAKDDLEIYEECDQEYSVLDSSNSNSNSNLNKFSNLNSLFSSKPLVSSNFNSNRKGIFSASSSFENLRNLESSTKEPKNPNALKRPFGAFSSAGNLTSLKITEKQEEKIEEKMDIEEKTEENSSISNTNNTSNSNSNNNNEMNIEGIVKNSQENQMEQLDRIFKEMNSDKEAKVIIKAYKSKLKSKFTKIYESNSEFYKQKNKLKIFHKCNFPGCSRTFASAGWLKSHFNEHMEEIKLNKFNVEFERSLKKLRYKQILN